MNNRKDWKSHDLTRGEKIIFGPMAGLEVLFNQYIYDLENYLFDELSIPFQIDCQVDVHYKFREFIEQFQTPQPIFIFELSPLRGEVLLILENRFANLFLLRDKLKKQKKVSLNNKFQVTDQNYGYLEKVVSSLLDQLQENWCKLIPVQKKLKQLVSHRIKAKIMNPTDSCVVVRINFSWGNFQTSMLFCFSGIQLDPFMGKISRQALLQATSLRRHPNVQDHFSDLLEEITYELQGSLGTVNVSSKELLSSFETGEVLPISNPVGTESTLKLNGIPMLAGQLGSTGNNYSVQITGEIQQIQNEYRKKSKKFQKFQFSSL